MINPILFLQHDYRAHTSISVEVKQYVDSLMTRAVRPICTVLQVLGHNRARQRDKWAHLLDDLVTLQDEVLLYLFYSLDIEFRLV